MRFWSVFRKCALEQKRDLWVLGLSLAFAPLFVLLYWMFTGGNASTSYAVLVINQDIHSPNAGEQAILEMQNLTYKDGSNMLQVHETQDRSQAEKKLRNRGAALLIIIPADFSTVLLGEAGQSTALEFVGDISNPYYTIAAVMAMSAIDQYVAATTDVPRPVELVETALGASAARTEFEIYVPGLLVLAVILMIFQAAMLLTREVESGTLRRLQITRLTAFELIGGTTAWLLVIAIAEVLLTFGVAVLLGFRSQGAIWMAIMIGIMTGFSIIGTGMIVAAFSRTVSQAFVIANFPLGFFMFLSGAAFPVPMPVLFRLGEIEIGLGDFLPPTHAVSALNKIFTLGVDFGELVYEFSALTLLSLAYFAIGVWLFRRRQMQQRNSTGTDNH